MTLAARNPSPTLARLRPRGLTRIPRPILGGVLAIVLYVIALVGLSRAPSTVFGLLGSNWAGPVFLMSVLLAVGAALGAIRARQVRTAWALVALVVLLLRLPTAVLTQVPFYSWTYKHLGITDYILVNGHVTNNVDIYSGWPSFFAAQAWFTSVTGMPQLTIAQWFIVGVDLICVVAFYSLFRSFGMTRGQALLGTLIGSIANCVGQDYYSPQATAFTLALLCLAMLLKGRRQPKFGVASLLPYAAIVMDHQLTPYWLIAATLVLGLLGGVRPRWIGIAYGAIAGVWLQLNRAALQSNTIISGGSAVPSTGGGGGGGGGAAATPLSLGDDLTQWAARAIAGGMIALAVIGLLRMYGRGRLLAKPSGRRWRAIWVAVLVFSPYGMLAVQSYGGEGLYRSVLFSIPGCAIAIVDLLYPPLMRPFAPGSWRWLRRIPTVASVAVVIGATVPSLQVSYGPWFSNLVSRGSYEMDQHFLKTAPRDSFVIGPVAAGADRSDARYAEFVLNDPGYSAAISAWDGWGGQTFTGTKWLTDLDADLLQQNRPVYMVFCDQMFATDAYYGIYPPGALARMKAAVLASTDWSIVDRSGDTILLKLNGSSAT